MSRRKLRATPALRAYIKRFAPKPAAPKAPPVDNPYHRFFTQNRSLEELARPDVKETLKGSPCETDSPDTGEVAQRARGGVLAAKRTEGESL